MTMPQPEPDEQVVPLRSVPDPAPDDKTAAEGGDGAQPDTETPTEQPGTDLVPADTVTKLRDEIRAAADAPRSAWTSKGPALRDVWAWVHSNQYCNSSAPAVNAFLHCWGVFAVIVRAAGYSLMWLTDRPTRAIPAAATLGLILLIWWIA